MAEEKIMMTPEGKEKLEKEYRHLIDVERPEVIEALKAARSQGDLSENADYDSARNRQAEIEARITEIEHIRDVAVLVVVTPSPASEAKAKGKIVAPEGKAITLGNVVTVKNQDGTSFQVKLVGTVESDPMADPALISNESPLGMALLGHVAGDKVLVESDAPHEVTIEKVEVVR